MQIKPFLLGLLTAAGALASSSDAMLEARDDKQQPPPKGLANRATLRIMPLGASITEGSGSSKDRGGFRRQVREELAKAGNPVNMVGSRKGGDFGDNDHEGWSGIRIDDLRDKVAGSNGSLAKYKPNIVLLHVGTNDAVQDKDIDTAGERLEKLVKEALERSSRAVVVVAALVHNRKEEVDKRIEKINDQYRRLVAKLQKDGKKVLLVDMAGSDGPQTKEDAKQYADDTHPNDEGYKRMADLWIKGVREADRRGWIRTPEWAEATNGPRKPAGTLKSPPPTWWNNAKDSGKGCGEKPKWWDEKPKWWDEKPKWWDEKPKWYKD